MGWFWASEEKNESAKISACPIDHKALAKQQTVSACPVDHKSFGKSQPTACPVKHSNDTPDACPVNHKGLAEKINPLNNMPANLSSDKAPGQKINLSTERTFSTIPRGEKEDEGVWEYPSPQQMLNAMLRKGKDGIDEDAVESMVDVHNFLNEGAWQEILEWEEPHTKESSIAPRLKKFTGRPFDLSPRASIYLQLSKIFPSHFNSEKPFDRHDWTVLRAEGPETWREVRYVIDYYGGPDDESGLPSFILDVRPALDNPTNAFDRVKHYWTPIYRQAFAVDDRGNFVGEKDN